MKYLKILLLFLIAACTRTTEESTQPGKFSEKHRPQYHFSPPSQWMNDPNGMFFKDGEYHLFYQYHPDSNVWGPMHWGHAVSEDMISWKHLPISLYPDSLGYIFSGSIVLDKENTSGFGDQENPPLVAIFTHAWEDERGVPQRQSLAYSLDNARTWTKFEGNPVIDENLMAFRDPKVFWNATTKMWIMSLAATTDNIGARPDHIRFYGSKDLKEWNYLSDFGYTIGSQAGKWECPDLFKMKVENSDEEKWVLLVSVDRGAPQGGSGTQYFVGDFDGQNFTLDPDFFENESEGTAVWVDHGADNYAGVTWSNIPEEDGRRLFIGWMSNWQYAQIVPTTKWRSAMTLPRELKLVRNQAGAYRLHSSVVQEIDNYLGEESSIDQLFDSTFMIEAEVENDFEITLSNDDYEFVTIGAKNGEFFIDRTSSGIMDFSPSFGAIHTTSLDGIVLYSIQIFVDASSIEVFVNGGELVMSELLFPNSPFNRIGSEGASSPTVRSVKSIWNP